jgi:hypothetical protein
LRSPSNNGQAAQAARRAHIDVHRERAKKAMAQTYQNIMRAHNCLSFDQNFRLLIWQFQIIKVTGIRTRI